MQREAGCRGKMLLLSLVHKNLHLPEYEDINGGGASGAGGGGGVCVFV